MGSAFSIRRFLPRLPLTLAVLRWFEWRVPRPSFARLTLCFKGHIMSEDELEQLLRMEGSTIHQVDYRQTESGAAFEYKVVVSTFGLNRHIGRFAQYPRVPRLAEGGLVVHSGKKAPENVDPIPKLSHRLRVCDSAKKPRNPPTSIEKKQPDWTLGLQPHRSSFTTPLPNERGRST